MPAPLSKVGTTVAIVNLDVSRKLNWGKDLVLEFITPDRSQVDNWAIEKEVRKGFDRIISNERTEGDGSTVVFEVADKDGTLAPILRAKDLHVRVNNQIYRVGTVPPLPPNVAQVYTLTCSIRTTRANFDTTKK